MIKEVETRKLDLMDSNLLIDVKIAGRHSAAQLLALFHKLRFEFHWAKTINLAINVVIAFD